MALIADMVESWRNPRAVVRRHLLRDRSEPFAFSLLTMFLVLAFVGQWPALARQAALAPAAPLTQRLVAAGLAVLASVPFWYGLAALSHLITRHLFNNSGGFYGARLALFCALLAIAPLMLLHGLVIGFLGQGVQANLIGGLVALGFVYLWFSMLSEAGQTTT